ncbi:MAG: hypothetical protein H6Q52_23 [Deltaproteobacteria bacterium]|nr:hypothetical protein [Deltaproteobacteria bacterium]
MELFVVMDKSMLGRGVFGVFSSREKAQLFIESFEFHSLVEASPLIGTWDESGKIYAAHTYDHFYDTHVFDGIYSQCELAYDVVGQKGLIIEFIIDLPDEKKIIV